MPTEQATGPMSRLGIGTVQFGMPYGISNRLGQPSETEVEAVLGLAADAGVRFLDTSHAYPNAEALIGRYSPSGNRFKIVTKTPPAKPGEANSGRRVREALAQSLERLRVPRVYAILVHNADELGGPNGEEIAETLLELKASGVAERIGVSVYSVEQLELAEVRLKPDLVQLPVNVLDRRIVTSSCFERLKAAGTEMHARSVFLQGLLLMRPAEVPPYFEKVTSELAALHERWRRHDLSPLAGCLGSVLGIQAIDAVIVGLNARSEFRQIQAAVAAWSPDQNLYWAASSTIETRFLDPSRWPSFA